MAALIPCKENGVAWSCPRWHCLLYTSCDWSDDQQKSCKVPPVPIDRRSVMSESQYQDYLVSQVNSDTELDSINSVS